MPYTCAQCGRSDVTFSTRSNGHGKRYYNKVCCSCRSRASRMSRKSRIDPMQLYRTSRNEQLQIKYGITLAEYESIFAAQNYGCAICGNDDRLNKKYLSMPMDHSHATGKNRAILCNSCNNMLGRAKDDPNILRRAADYLESFNGL